METQSKSSEVWLLKLCLILLPLLITGGSSIAQVGNLNTVTKPLNTSSLNLISGNDADLFGIRTRYIENIGQYGDTLAMYGSMGKILYGYEGLGMPVLFTSKGLIHLQRKTKKTTYEEMERQERKGVKAEGRIMTIDRTVTMEWVNANTDPQIITEDICHDYFSYGLFKKEARAYKKIIYKELYPGIDLVYSFTENKKAGFEYSLVVSPNADMRKIKLKYGGDVKNIATDKNGNLIIRSDIGDISISNAVCYYAESNAQKFNTGFRINRNEVSFKLPENYTKEKSLVIDPFVSGTGNLGGSTDAGKAKDIDYDYAGNIYVVGGGDGAVQNLAKYDTAGVLQWTFNGSLNIPSWKFGAARGGWVTEKVSGNIYLGQGLESSGFRIIRLNTNGLYDNYITTGDPAFQENWKMLWACDNAVPSIFAAGGGGNSNKELAIVSPPSPILSPSNLTGINTGHNDISDIIIDPVSNDLYTIFSTSAISPGTDNKIYKHKSPYTSSSIAWSTATGYFALSEPINRPYINGLDNSSNTLAINAGYLFYWDGKNLKAFNKADGSVAGTPISLATNAKLMHGGIVADECNNIFVGAGNGTIKVYQFNGSVFDDNAAADISIPGFSASSVYDMVYDHGKGLLYACGNGFVASIDVSRYCATTVYSVNVSIDCSSSSVTTSLNPVPPAGSVITYNLFNGTTLVASNSTGYFNGLTAGLNYTIVALVNQACGGTQVIANFTTALPPVLKINNPSAICSDNTADLTVASITTGSTTGLTFTYWLDAACTIACTEPSKAIPGTYYIKGTSSAGCSVIAPVGVTTLPAPKPNAGTDTIICFGNNGQLNGSGGSSYYWSPSTNLSNAGISNPKVTNPGIGSITYHLKVRDAIGCLSEVDDEVKITFAMPAKIFIAGDTVVSINQPLQLNAMDMNNSGFTDFTWSPSQGLNNPFIPNPVAILNKDITYTIHASTINRCTDDAQIKIKVFRGPEIYVPNSFTPNGDNANDLLKPIPVGLREFHYFNVFNRFGQLLFSTTNAGIGWDGKIQGKEQNSGTYVWIAEGIDYKGNIIQQKGYSTLIR